MKRLSLLMIVKNCDSLLGKSLLSVSGLVDEIVVVDNESTDKTIKIAKRLGARVFRNGSRNLGKLREYGLNKCKGKWVLVLDSDERLSLELKEEIRKLFVIGYLLLGEYTGFKIPFQNFFLNRPLKYGGENYKKLILFKRNKAKIKALLVHEKFEVDGKIGILKNKVLHYSYRSLSQTYKKFTDYAIREAKQKYLAGEKSSFKKIFLYPVHMFWARFIKDKGYKDGGLRILLDIGFGYMEFVTYLYLFYLNVKCQSSNVKSNSNFK